MTLAVGLLTVAVLPVATDTVGRDTGFLPAQLSAVGCLYLIALSLLAAAFLRSGSRRLLAISVAYGWAFVVMLGHAAAFPGVMTAHGPLATSGAVVTWLHLCWQVGLPVLLTLAWTVPAVGGDAIPLHQRNRTLAAGLGIAVATSAAVVAAVTAAGPDLPDLVIGTDATRFRQLTAPVAVPLLLIAVVVCWRATRRETGPARWTMVTVAACAADIFCFYAAGERFTVGWYAGRLLTVAGALAIVVGLLVDLAGAHARLDAEQARYRATLDNLSEGVILRDRDGIQLLSNAAAAPVPALAGIFREKRQLSRFSFGLPFRRPDGTLLDPDDFPAVRALRTGEASRATLLAVDTPDGSRVWLSVNANPVRDAKGEVTSVVTSFTDVTESRRVMAELEAARDAAVAGTRAKSEFLAMVSHELRTPLNGLLGMNGLLLGTELGPEQREYALSADSCGRALLALVDDLLDISTLDAARLRVARDPVCLDRIVGDALGMFREPAAAKGLELDAWVDDAIPAGLRGDASRLRQLVSNLLANAMKYTTAGSVRVRVSLDEETGDDALVRFAVSDTGIGVDGDVERLFEPFEQGDSSSTRRYDGSGLGLSIVRRFAHAMGGEAGGSGTTGAGSTFWFTVRLARDGETAESATAPPPTASSWTTHSDPLHGRVLVAEDNPVNQLVVTRLLESWGLLVDCVGDGAAPVTACAGTDYDVVLMDCQMPVLDGFAATRRLHELTGRHETPVVALTASGLAEDARQCEAAGMVAHLAKPLDPAALHDTLEHYLNEDPALRTRA